MDTWYGEGCPLDFELPLDPFTRDDLSSLSHASLVQLVEMLSSLLNHRSKDIVGLLKEKEELSDEAVLLEAHANALHANPAVMGPIKVAHASKSTAGRLKSFFNF